VSSLDTARILAEVSAERVRQVARWGEQNHPDGTSADEKDTLIRDIYRAAADSAAEHGTLTWRDILREEVYEAFAEKDHAALREELVQVAAVAAAWIEDIDRRPQP
jgi:hypothetical protein